MQGTSKVILGATLIMVVCLAIVLGLILVLLAELYCSLLLHRRRLRVAPPTTSTSNSSTDRAIAATNISRSLPSAPSRDNNRPAISLSSLYAHGVLSAPRNFLFPSVPCVKDNNVDVVEAKSQSSQLHRVIDIVTHESPLSPHQIGLISTPPRPLSPFISASPDLSIPKVRPQSKPSPAIACSNDSSSNGSDHFMYISNPIFDNDAIRRSSGDTPFETPNSSPSRLEACGSSEEDEIVASPSSTIHSLPNTPPLTPMKKLPAEASSVTLRDARSLGNNSVSDSNTNNGLSSSSSGSPCTSPSW